MKASPSAVTQWLRDWQNGRQEALDQLMPVVYDELRQLAARYLRRERPDHTLQPTALVHEAYFQLIDQRQRDWQSRAHFIGLAAALMRRILLEHARHHRAVKRGGGVRPYSLAAAADLAWEPAVDLEALDEALTRLAAVDAQQGRTVELRFFGGLSIEETAEVLGVSTMTVKRDWRVAKMWLQRALDGGQGSGVGGRG